MTRIITYTYGVRILREHNEPPELGDELVRRTRYWNALVETEKEFRDTIDALVAPHIMGASEEEQRASRKDALKLPDVVTAIQIADQYRKDTAKRLRGESGLGRGNYLAVERAWQTSRQRDARALRFHRSSPREGTLSHAWTTRPMSVPEFLGNPYSLCSVEPVDDAIYALPPNARAKAAWTPFRFRITGTRTDPIYLTGVVCLHRQLPAEGHVREARLVVAPRNAHKGNRYELHLAIELPDVPATDRSTTWGVDVGWRQHEGALRVAVAVADTGEQRSLSIPAPLVALFTKAKSLPSIIDNLRNDIRATLVAYRGEANPKPEWLTEELANIGQWESAGRFHWLFTRWQAARHDGDRDVFEALERWHHRSRHLEQYLTGTRERAQRWRDYLYGSWALDLVRAAGCIAIEDTKWTQMAAEQTPAPIGWQRSVASPGALLERISQTAGREGVAIVKVPATKTTVICSWCSHENTYNAAAAVVVRCANCNRQYDQDVNAARNIIARTTSAAATTLRSAPRESRFARLARLKAEAAGARSQSEEESAPKPTK